MKFCQIPTTLLAHQARELYCCITSEYPRSRHHGVFTWYRGIELAMRSGTWRFAQCPSSITSQEAVFRVLYRLCKANSCDDGITTHSSPSRNIRKLRAVEGSGRPHVKGRGISLTSQLFNAQVRNNIREAKLLCSVPRLQKQARQSLHTTSRLGVPLHHTKSYHRSGFRSLPESLPTFTASR